MWMFHLPEWGLVLDKWGSIVYVHSDTSPLFIFYQVLHVGARWDGKDRQMLGSEVAEKLSKQKEWIGKQKVAWFPGHFHHQFFFDGNGLGTKLSRKCRPYSIDIIAIKLGCILDWDILCSWFVSQRLNWHAWAFYITTVWPGQGHRKLLKRVGLGNISILSQYCNK